MTDSRSILTLMIAMITALAVAQTATAQRGGKGNGGKGGGAAVGIEAVHLINQQSGDVLAEISGGGFLGGNSLSVTLDDGTVLSVDEATQTMILATIPKNTPDGDYDLTVSTGKPSKQNASAPISLGGTMTVACIDWFRSGPADEHVHTEVHIEDENGNAVIGAVVTWTAENDTFGVYQTNVSPTQDIDGHANGAGRSHGLVLLHRRRSVGWRCSGTTSLRQGLLQLRNPRRRRTSEHQHGMGWRVPAKRNLPRPETAVTNSGLAVDGRKISPVDCWRLACPVSRSYAAT